MKLNLPNKITIVRIVLAFIILIIMLVPFDQIGFAFPIYYLEGMLLDSKYILVAILFVLAALTDALDGYIARSRSLVTDLGKTMDAIADKVLVNGLLIVLAYQRVIPVCIPVVIITRDIITDSCKSVVGSKSKVVAASSLGKIKTIFVMVGLTLVLFYDLPFSLFGFYIGEILLFIGCVLSVISGADYVKKSLPIIIDEKSNKKK